jgi:cell division septum initiation protein DivIVA
MGESDFKMDGKIENFMGYAFRDELLKGKFNFKSNFLNLNPFLSEDESTAATSAAADTASVTAFEVPENIDFTLTSSIGKLLYDKLEITAMQGEVVIAGGKVSMNNVNMNLLDGRLGMNGYYATTGKDPEVKFDLNIQDFDIKKSFDAFNTVQKIAPMAEKCTGKFGMSFSFTSLLDQAMEPLMNTLNGAGNINTKNIVISNISVLEKAGEYLKKDQFKTMQLVNALVKFMIKDGNIEVEPFTTKVDQSEITFGGKQSIDQLLNYDLIYKIPSKALGSAANDIFKNMTASAGVAGVDLKMPEIITVNGKILGTLMKPELKLDLKQQAGNVIDNVKEQVKDKINEEVDKAKAEAIKKAREQADKLNKEAETRAAQVVAAAEKTAQEIRNGGKTAADKVRSESETQAQNVINAAKGKGPIAEAAAKKSAETIRKEGNAKAADLESKANSEADGVVNKARQESESIKSKAKQEGDKLIEAASR